MYLGTSHLNLYKVSAKDVKSNVRIASNLNVSEINPMLFILSFLIISLILVSTALAAHAAQVQVSDGADRINRTGTSNSIIWRFNVTNQGGSADVIQMVNITNATGYLVTAVNATGNSTQACVINQLAVNCTGLSIAAGSQVSVNVTTTQPSVSGERTWTVYTQDSAAAVVATSVYTAAIDGADLAFDIRDELGNATAGTSVQLYNGSQVLFVAANVFTDSDNNGLILIESGNVSSQQADTVQFNVTQKGYADRNQTTTRNDASTTSYDPNSGNVGWNNGFRPTGILFGIKITVTDELGNSISDATVNVTQMPVLAGFNTTTPNHTASGVQYFALPSTFSNVTFIVTRGGFLNNQTFNNDTSKTFLTNTSAQVTGDSTYRLIYALRVNVTDELGSGTFFSNENLSTTTSFFINTTSLAVPNRSSSNLAYFSINQTNWKAVNVTVNRTGWINTSVANIPLNASTQAKPTTLLPYVLKLNISDERGNSANMDSNGTVTIQLNGTTSTRNTTNSSQQNVYYFAIPQTLTAVNITVNKTGYVFSNAFTGAAAVPLNTSTQASLFISLPFTIRVTDVCNTIGGPGHCYALDGTTSFAELSTSSVNTTYSDGDAYINATGTVSLIAGANGFVNTTVSIITNESTQAKVAFNASGASGANVNTSSIPFTIRVTSVYDELAGRNASSTLNSTAMGANQRGVGIDVLTQLNNIFFNTTEGQAYVNATGTSAISLVAFAPNQSFVNSTLSITPTAAVQRTVIFNGTGDNTTDNGKLAFATGSGLKYIIKINVTDELGYGNSSYLNSGVTFGFNSTPGLAFLSTLTADAQNNNVYYFTNQSWPLPNGTNVTVARNGFINTSSVTNVPINASTQANITIQLPFNLRAQANDELSQALGIVVNFSVNASGSARPNITSGSFAYYSLPLAAVGGSGGFGAAYVNMSKIGYVDNGTSVHPLNTSTQARATANLPYTVRVTLICDELNATCFTADGVLTTDGTAASEISGLSTNYSAGVAYIPAVNGSSSTITAAARGYVNTTVSVIPLASSRNTTVAFNATGVGGSVNASGLPFSVRIQGVCDQLNYTCFTLNGSASAVGAAGFNITGPASGSVNSTRYNTTANIAYLPVPGTSAVDVVAFALGYINTTQSVTPTPASAQVTMTFNASNRAMNYSTAITLLDELSTAANMNSGVRWARNISAGAGTVLVENTSVFRSSPNSNFYFMNVSTGNIATPGAANITAKKDGYVNTTTPDFPVNSSAQGNITLRMPFAVKVNSGSVIGVTATVVTGSSSFSSADGNSSTDVNSSKDGFIYWALNQTQVVGGAGANVDLTVSKSNFVPITFDDVNLNFSTQLSVSPTMIRSNADDTVAPVITMTSPTAGSNVTSTSPTIAFNIIDNTGGSGIETTSIAVNVSGFNFTRDCTVYNSLNVSCSFTSSGLTDAVNNTVSIGANDNAGIPGTNATRNFGVLTSAGVTATLNTSDTSAIADNTFANGWSFTFNITLGSITANATTVNATAVKIANWTRSGGSETIPTAGNTIMEYTISNGTAATYYVSHNYNTTDTIYPLQDGDSGKSIPINGTVTVKVKLPTSITPGTYTTTFTFGSWSVALTGGNPT